MVLGSCGWGVNYNGSNLSISECYKALEYFEKNDGEIVDTAPNYPNAHSIIKDYKWSKKIITKVWSIDEIDRCFDELGVDHIYCIMNRNIFDDKLREKLGEYQKKGLIDKIGASIYYENELRQNYNAFHIHSFFNIGQLNKMFLHADIYLRTIFNCNYPKNIDLSKGVYRTFKNYERQDLNHLLYPVIGVSNLDQLKQDMRLFK